MGLNRCTRKRFRWKLRRYGEALVAGEWSEAEFQRHAQPLCAFTQQVRSWHFRRIVLNDLPACRNATMPRFTHLC
jgi:hypothetical protein